MADEVLGVIGELLRPEKPWDMRPKPRLVIPAVRECLFCKRKDGSFTSQEHVLPEALMNDRLILPPGIVCDRCNNGPLSRVDQEFLNFAPIALMRTVYGIPTK